MIESSESRLLELNDVVKNGLGDIVKKELNNAYIARASKHDAGDIFEEDNGQCCMWFQSKQEALESQWRCDLNDPPEGTIFVSRDTKNNTINYILQFKRKKNGWYEFSDSPYKWRKSDFGYRFESGRILAPVKTIEEATEVAHWLFMQEAA